MLIHRFDDLDDSLLIRNFAYGWNWFLERPSVKLSYVLNPSNCILLGDSLMYNFWYKTHLDRLFYWDADNWQPLRYVDEGKLE